MVITFNSDVRFRRITYRDAQNEQWKLLRYSNGHNFSFGCPIQAHHISRCSKWNNGSSRDIQMVITFHTEVRFRRILHRDARNGTTKAIKKFKWSKLFTRMSDSGALHIEKLELEQWKLSRNSNGHKFSHECSIQENNISRRSKLNSGSSRQIWVVINFHTDVQFGDIKYRDARN